MAPTAPTTGTASMSASDETTPLLPASVADNSPISPSSEPSPEEQGPPFPTLQILLLCYASLAEPIAYFSLFPYINEMLTVVAHLPPTSVGFYAGAIESLFSLVQMTLMLPYARLADRVGRKTVLVGSLAGISVATAGFGTSRSLGAMVAWRCAAGCCAGSVVTVRTMLAEGTGKSGQARAFGWWMFARQLGLLVGPIVGGGLANPAREFPGAFGRSVFFTEHPYALPSFVAAGICGTGVLTSLFFLKETLAHKPSSTEGPTPKMSTWEVLTSPGVPAVLYIFGHTILLGLAYTAVAPLFQFTPIPSGGLSFPPRSIAYVLMLGGGSQALWMLLAFPYLQRKLGTGTLLRCSAAVWPVFMALYPLANELLRRGYWTAFWAVGAPALVVGSGVAMAFACVQLCLNDIAPSQDVLATVNALALTVNSGIRAVAPALFASLFAAGVRSGWAHGHLVWMVLVALALGLNVGVRFLPEKAEGRPVKKAGGEGEA